KKYYKSLFFGLVDVAIVNAYIVFREAQKGSTEKPVSHAEFLMELHAALLDLSESDFAEQVSFPCSGDVPPPLPPGHEPQECPEYQYVNGVRKRQQRQCKVCSVLKRRVGERRATKYYCAACSKSDKGRYVDVCYQIWHHKWENGTKRPKPRCGRDFQSREVGANKSAGKRKRQSQNNEEEDSEEAAKHISSSNVEGDVRSGEGSDSE
ncbi:hypothetical protein PHYSODRAFT_475315, partial [Phytophthora sojae]